MRVIVHGVGAIGGAIAARLALAGQEVVGIARGAQLAAIQANGLLLRDPDRAERARLPCVADPAEIDFRVDDAILLTMKAQDTVPALERLRAAGVAGQPIFCAQNSVANERLALRRFPNVHAITVMMPATYRVPGEVAVFATPHPGIFEIGRYPSGADADDERLAAALEAAGFATFVMPDTMEGKYGKLMMNLHNIVEAALGRGAQTGRIDDLLRAEARAALAAAGIPWRDVGAADPRRDALMRQRPVEGVERAGGSSTQSLLRGAGSIETDYLNGEIVLLGRLYGVPTPANAFFVDLSARMLREGIPAGGMPRDTVEAGLAAAGAGP
ncbi:MAG: 2-dehydropantoate 2-reductase N-terminal domain-containing protein [Amaricoccus sp.]